MRALTVSSPGVVEILDVPPPVPSSQELIVTVERAGVCGTDVEFVRGTQPYLLDGGASFPIRIGHEWAGVVNRVGSRVDEGWVGRRVTADTMLGCQRCALCRAGRQHLCAQRTEIGVLRGRHGALADEIAVPVHAVRALPEGMSAGCGALVEPGSLAYRCVVEAGIPAGAQLAVLGTGAIGLLCVALASRLGIRAHVVARSARYFELAMELGAVRTWLEASPPSGSDGFDAVVSVSPDPGYPSLGRSLVRPGGMLVLAGISGEPSPLEVRDLVVKDIGTKGLLSGSPVFDRSILAMHDLGDLTQRVVGAVVTLEELAEMLMTGPPDLTAPKIHADLQA